MAYAEICACIRTLQEATFQQESEIFRLREREAHLKQLVIDLSEKLQIATGSKDIRKDNVPGTEQHLSRDAFNSTGSFSQDSRVHNGTLSHVAETQAKHNDSAQQTSLATALKTTPALKRKEIASPTPSPKCDRKPSPAMPAGPLCSTGQTALSPVSTRHKNRATEAGSPRQPLKVTKSAGPAILVPPPPQQQQQQQMSPPIDATYDVITFANMDTSQMPEVSKATKKKHGTRTMPRGSMDDLIRRTLLSSDMETNLEDRIMNTITLRYGDLERVKRATLCIQRAYRAYTMRKHYTSLLKQGPATRRRRTNTGVGIEGKRTKRLSIMENHGGPHSHGGGGANPSRTGSNLARVDTMNKLREKSNLYKERRLMRRDRLCKAGSSQLIASTTITTATTTITSEVQDDLIDSATPSPEVGRKTSLKRLGGVFAEGEGAGTQHHPLQRSRSTEVFRSAGSMMSSEDSNSDTQEKTSVDAPLLQYKIGIHQFNRKPTTGIQYLVSVGLLEDSPLHVAKFFHEQVGLSKLRIGEFLGEIRMEFNMAVLNHMAGLINMKNKPIDDALREFQKMFLMPGEAQKIDKIMQTFAAEYFKANSDLVENEDAAYVLSFAIMMLHTSLHNPSVKHKTSVEQWVSMNRGNNGGKDFPKQMLVEIYERIKKTPFVTGQDHTTVLMEIQQRLVGSSIHNLVNPQRSLVLKACVFELDCMHSHKRKPRKRTLLIFNDLVIVTKRNKEQYVYKTSFPLFNTAATQFNLEAAQYGIQIYSLLDKKILLQCSSETEEDHRLLLQTLLETINTLGELEKARIAGLVTTLDQNGGNSKHMSIVMEDCDHISSGNQNSQQQKRSSVNFIVGVGNIEGAYSQSTLSL